MAVTIHVISEPARLFNFVRSQMFNVQRSMGTFSVLNSMGTVVDKQTQQFFWSDYEHWIRCQTTLFNAEMMYLGPIELICMSQFCIAIKIKIVPSKFWPDIKYAPKISENSRIDAF